MEDLLPAAVGINVFKHRGLGRGMTDDVNARQAQEWCLRMLEAQGPFFPKVVALDVLGA